MSITNDDQFVAGDEDLDLHRLFSFNYIDEATAADVPLSAESCPALLLGSPFAGPHEDLQGQLGLLSPLHIEAVDGLDVVNFDDFLALDESSEDRPVALKEPPAPPPPPPPELADSNPSQDKPDSDPAPADDLADAANLDAARDEIAQLKTAMAAESLQPKVSTPPEGRQSSSSPQKRKLDGGEMSPPKRQVTTKVGPIEALWSSKMNEGERTSLHSLAIPPTPKPPSPRLSSTAHFSASHTNSLDDCSISPENLHSIQTFLNDNPELVYGTSRSINISTSPSNVIMANSVNTKAKQLPRKPAPRRAPKTMTVKNIEITKKPAKAAQKKTQHRRKTSASSKVAPSLDTSASHRSIDELLAANFYSMNAQEKLRIMLPMLRNLDPRELEKSLAGLPSIQAKGAGHEVRVTRAIQGSPPTPEDDDVLAMKLTFGTPPSPTPAGKRFSTSPPATALEASSLSSKVTRVQVNEDHGAIRQREALEKAALLQMQGV